MELFCKNCDTSCTEIEGDFSCLGILSKKTTVEEVIARVNELYCKNCKPPILSVESSCSDNYLEVNLTSMGSSQKVSIEVYQNDAIVAIDRVTSTGLNRFNLPYGDYKIRAFNTYNFECSTGFINFSHQCLYKPCLAPIVTINKTDSPGSISINVTSLGEATEVTISVVKNNQIVFSKTTSYLETFTIPASIGTYTISISGKCPNGAFTTEVETVNIIDHTCGIYISGFSYDCNTNIVTVNPIGGSLQYEYSLDNLNWYSTALALPIIRNSFQSVYVRDKNNTSCVYVQPFSATCDCHISFNVSNVQCNQLGCIISWDFTGVQCNNTLICTISGTISNAQP